MCKNLNRGFLDSLIKDAEEGSRWKKLDINSVYGPDGLVKDFREWKEIGTGQQWKLDLDSSYISSAIETADYIPEISGAIRRTSDSGEKKYACYLKNGKNGRLGTEITKEMHEADASTEVQKKFITWLPDLITRVPVAIGTVALIPSMLKVLHIEKSPKKTEQQKNIVTENNLKDKEPEAKKSQGPSFKGNKPQNAGFFRKLFNKLYGEIYGKRMYEWNGLRNVSEKSSKALGGMEKMSQHFQAVGALFTSSTYIARTLNNADLDKDRRKTLAINQGLCFIIPTALAYLVDHLLNALTKKIEYRYAGKKEQKINRLRATKNPVDAQKIEEITKTLNRNLRGVRIVSGLVTFTLIYRYLSPVLMTPLANKISEVIKERKQAKAEAALQAKENSSNNVKLAAA